MAGSNGEGNAVSGDGGGVNPGTTRGDSKIVHEQARFKIVGAVEDQVEAGEQFGSVARGEVGDEAFDGNRGIDGAQLAFGGRRFRKSGLRIGFVEEGLALEIGRLDKIAVENSDATDASANQQRGRGRTNRATADNNGAGSQEPLLARSTDAGKEHLTRVAFAE